MHPGSIKNGDIIILKNRPCKVTDIIRKCIGIYRRNYHCVTGVDLITGKKYEDIVNEKY